MHFVFASTTCSEKVYKEIFTTRTKMMIDPMQKFLLQIMRGLSADANNVVTSISVKPVSHSCYAEKAIQSLSDYENGITFNYIPFRNGRVSRFLSTYISVYRNTRQFLKEHSDTVVITDPLSPYISMAARKAAQRVGVKAIAIITDLPLFASNMKQRKEKTLKRLLRNVFEGFSNKEAKGYDAYIFVTESMNKPVNIKNKPFIIVEGTAVPPDDNTKIERTDGKRIFLYAGGVYEKYGVKCLVDAFCKARLDNVELHVYGEGTYVEELKKVCINNHSVKYGGCVLNTELQSIEMAADLLINPRFSDEEYTKYSFPSKTLEYLSTGTAVLSTRLKGIPTAYEPYLFWFDDESLDGMAKKLQEINDLSDEELDKKGSLGQKYVLDKKNNIAQGEKIARFAKSIIN